MLVEAKIEIAPDTHPLVFYMISWNQFLESALFGVFLGVLFLIVNALSERWNWDRLNFGRALFLKTAVYILGMAISSGIIYLILTGFGLVAPETYAGVNYSNMSMKAGWR